MLCHTGKLVWGIESRPVVGFLFKRGQINLIMRKIYNKIKRIGLLSQELKAMWSVADNKTFWKFVWSLFITLPTNLKKQNVNAAFDKMRGYQCVFHAFGKRIIIDGKWLGYAMGSYIRPDYFLPPHYILKEGMTVVDLGASGGDFAILAALFGGKVIAIEAKGSEIKELIENAKLNNCADRIIALHGIVGAGSGCANEKGNFRRILKDNPPPVLNMNEVLKDVEKVDFLKMDIEGSEFDLLSNNTKWLAKVDKVSAEVHSEFGDINWLKETLEKHGFEVTLVIDNQKSTHHGIGKELMYARKLSN